MKYYRLMTSLPELPDVPATPPAPLGDLIADLREELTPAHWELASALILRLDIANLEAALQGRPQLIDARGVLPPEWLPQAKGTNAELAERNTEVDVDLPSFIEDFLEGYSDGAATSAAYAFDALWRAYYAHVTALGQTRRCRFLLEWAQFEVPLLNVLAMQRAQDLHLDSAEAQLDEPPAPARHDDLMTRLQEEENPQNRERILDTARLAFFDNISGIDPFSVDAVLAYLAAAMVLDRWRLPETEQPESLLEVFA